MTSPTDPAARVERYARAIFAELWSRDPDRFGPAYDHDREACEAVAQAAIALADEERAAAVPDELWAEYERIMWDYAYAGQSAEARATLDAFVRRLMAATPKSAP